MPIFRLGVAPFCRVRDTELCRFCFRMGRFSAFSQIARRIGHFREIAPDELGGGWIDSVVEVIGVEDSLIDWLDVLLINDFRMKAFLEVEIGRAEKSCGVDLVGLFENIHRGPKGDRSIAALRDLYPMGLGRSPHCETQPRAPCGREAF